LLAASLLLAACPLGFSRQPPAPVKVVIDEEKSEEAALPILPIDPQPRIVYGFGPTMAFGFLVDGQRITYSLNGSTNNTMVRIDGRDMPFGGPNGKFEPRQAPLEKGPHGKERRGHKTTWIFENIHITQILEVVPSRAAAKAAPGQKRRLDVCRILYLIENKDARAHTVGIRNAIDILVVDNDGALFASPTTHPNKILNGVELKDKEVPEYLQVLQRPDLQNPGFVSHFTFKMGNRLVGPDRVVMTNLGACFGGWDIPAQPAGDSAIGIYFSPQEVKAHGKRELGYAYGGSIASNPENEGKVRVTLGGSFEPNKLFTVAAYVDDPLAGQTVTLELPAGMERVEGKELQAVPPPGAEGRSLVLWKARVLRTGKFTLKVHSSNGLIQSRTITISPASAGNAGLREGNGKAQQSGHGPDRSGWVRERDGQRFAL
jgi:hypothetical protein